MKKFITIAALIISVSCTHQNQNIDFNLHLTQAKSTIGNGSAVDLIVFDDRSENQVIGIKEFGADEKIKIISTQNIALLLTDQINNYLNANGFKKGSGKIMEVHIEKLHYLAKRGFFVGTSEGEAALRVVIRDAKNRLTFTKNFGLKLDGKHFIAPLESTDFATINSLLNDITQEVVNNQDLLKKLAAN